MFVSDWMTKKVITVSPDDSILQATGLAKDNSVKHLPVVKDGRIKGIISDRDIKEYVPSKAASQDVYELHSLLAKTKVKNVMKSKVLTIRPDTPVEEAAMIMLDNNIGCLPVVDGNKLAGIISDRDIFRVLVNITGVRHRGHRIHIPVEDRSGAVRDALAIMKKHGFIIQSILTSYEGVKKGNKNIIIRIKGRGDFNGLRAELEATYIGVKLKKG
jgi:acetoin utilization protein AcuB